MKFDTANMCLHLQKKLFDEDGAYHHLLQAPKFLKKLTRVTLNTQKSLIALTFLVNNLVITISLCIFACKF